MPTPAPLLLAVPFFPATAPAALADAALKSAALLLLAALVAPFLKKFSAAARHALWSGALAAALLLPLLSLALPAWRVPWLPSWETVATPPVTDRSPLREQRDIALASDPEPLEQASPSLTLKSPFAPLRDDGVAAPSDPFPPSNPHSALHAPQSAGLAPLLLSPSSLLLLYFCGATLALLPLLAGWLHAARLTRRARPLDTPDWTALLADTMRALGLRAGTVRLLACTESGRSAAPGATMPFTCGARRPVVILPEAAAGWPAARRRLVLLHELGHVRRHDWLTQTLAALACALHWFNPLAWLAARQMRLEREQACDDLVLGSGQPAQDYARELLALAAASARGGFLHWTTVPMARPTTLEARLRAILDRRRNRAPLTPAATLALAALLAAVAIPFAMLRGAGEETKPPPPAAQSSAAPAPSASQPLQPVTIRLDGNSRYFYGDDPASVSFPDLQARLVALAALPQEQQPVIKIQGDSSVPFQTFRTLMDEMRRNNLTKINLRGMSNPTPGANTYALPDPPPTILPLSIAINAAGRYISSGASLTLTELRPLLAEIAGKPTGKPPRVIIWAEPGVPAQAIGELQEVLASLQLAPVRFGLLLTLDATGRSFLGDNPAPLTLAELRARLNEALAKPETERTFISIRADLAAKATALQALQVLTPSLGFGQTSFSFTGPADDIKAAVDAAALRPDDDTIAGWVAKVRDQQAAPNQQVVPFFSRPVAPISVISKLPRSAQSRAAHSPVTRATRV